MMNDNEFEDLHESQVSYVNTPIEMEVASKPYAIYNFVLAGICLVCNLLIVIIPAVQMANSPKITTIVSDDGSTYIHSETYVFSNYAEFAIVISVVLGSLALLFFWIGIRYLRKHSKTRNHKIE